MTEQTDRDLLAAMAAGDQGALAELYDRYGAMAFGLARRVVGDAGIAEEVVQDALVAAWRRAATYQPDRGEPRTWLLSIVHHRAIDRLRGAAAAGRRAEIELDETIRAVDPSDTWRAAWARLRREEIVAALDSLPPEQREAIELGFFAGLTHLEVAERTEQPLGTVKGRMRLGLLKLRTVLQGREIGPGK
jgi:RNA polymerase sigma-70 factor (ECF subfamily)